MDPVVIAVVRSAGRLTEGELRYQLQKRGHPMCDSAELLGELVDLERWGLVKTELLITAARA